MPKFPEPPPVDQLMQREPAVKLLTAGTMLWRLYFRSGPHPGRWDQFRTYGPVRTARFDHHHLPPHIQVRGILYAALHGPTCVAEVFQDARLVDRHRKDPWLVGFELSQDLRLLDLTGTWPTVAGASMSMSSGPRPRAQRWSRAIYGAYPQVQGLWYPSSMHANRPAVALYERATGAMPDNPSFHRALADPALLPPLRGIALEVGYGLV